MRARLSRPGAVQRPGWALPELDKEHLVPNPSWTSEETQIGNRPFHILERGPGFYLDWHYSHRANATRVEIETKVDHGMGYGCHPAGPVHERDPNGILGHSAKS